MEDKNYLERSMTIKDGLESSGSRQGQGVCCYGHVNETPVSIKCKQPVWPTKHSLLTKDSNSTESLPRSYLRTWRLCDTQLTVVYKSE